MEKIIQGENCIVEVKKNGLRRSTKFKMIYIGLLFLAFLLTMVLFKMPIVRSMDFADGFMMAISALIIVGIGVSFLTYLNTVRVAELIEELLSDDSSISFLRGELTVSEKFTDSIFVRHFQRVFSAKKFNWTGEAIAVLDQYLGEEFLYWPNWIYQLDRVVALMGFLGTILGTKMTFHGDITNILDTRLGLNLALDTTALALYGGLVILSLNHAVISERKLLLKVIVLIYATEERK